MPSRKRNQGRARKARVSAADAGGASRATDARGTADADGAAAGRDQEAYE